MIKKRMENGYKNKMLVKNFFFFKNDQKAHLILMIINWIEMVMIKVGKKNTINMDGNNQTLNNKK